MRGFTFSLNFHALWATYSLIKAVIKICGRESTNKAAHVPLGQESHSNLFHLPRGSKCLPVEGTVNSLRASILPISVSNRIMILFRKAIQHCSDGHVNQP